MFLRAWIDAGSTAFAAGWALPAGAVWAWMPGATSDMTNMAVASFLYVKLISSRDKPCVAGRLRELAALQPLAEPVDEMK